MPIITTEKIRLAAQFVNSTHSHIFLTGKAGTGKTTFLRDMAEATHKNFAIVAPTGIAALNARGVTIHSQFLLPFGTYLPQDTSFDEVPIGNFYTRNQLARKNPLNSTRKQVLRNIDLLIIDEVSMLRADILDAIDYRLKSVKGNFKQPFGGIQLLMIGDLFQLPPIVKDYEWEKLKPFYKSIHFFESLALKESGFTYIELDKIFRQQDDKFIGILNNLRNNACTREDIDALNTYYRKEGEEDTITITTHNYRADRINKQEMEKLPGKSYFYEAEVRDDFPEHLYPLAPSLELKEGAQIMFIKNDVEGNRYFNGKLAEVTKLSAAGIYVKMEGDDHFLLEEHMWENIKYTINPTTKDIEEEVIGTFTQYPIKPAWAITVHKSQGLTFEKAIIDVGQAFAPGQVYVALSRLRSLQGLVLHTRISESVISSDDEVVRFSGSKEQQPPLQETLKTEQNNFLRNLLHRTFDFSEIVNQIDYTKSKAAAKMEFEDVEMQTALPRLREALLAERQNTEKFQAQIAYLLQSQNNEKLLDRIEKGSGYYLDFLNERMRELLIHLEEVRQFSRTKTYQTALEEIDQLLAKKMEQVQKARYICNCILEGDEIERNEEFRISRKEKREKLLADVEEYIKENPKNFNSKTGRKRKKATAKGETYQQTYTLLKEGLKPEEIAEKRGLVLGTIESHLAKGIEAGELEVENMMDKEEIKVLKTAFDGNPHQNITEVFKNMEGKFSYGKLRMMQAHLRKAKAAVADT